MVTRFLIVTATVLIVLATIWFGTAQYLQARANAEAAQQEAEAARQAATQSAAEARAVAVMHEMDTRAAERVADTNVKANGDEGADADDDELAALTFLVGTWRGEMNGELVEEIWSRPQGNAMMGMFRWLNAEGQSRMYELLTISHEDGEVLLRLRHFTPMMIAWEEKDAPVVLKRAESARGRAVFVNVNEEDRMERIVFHQAEPEKLAIDVEFREGSGSAPLNFRFHAVK